MAQTQTIENEQIISTYVEVAVGTHPEVERSGGMILTEEDVINLKLYVKFGFALPENLKEVEAYLGYTSVGITGLEPKDIQTLFRSIKTNVSKWDCIEVAILNQSRELETFSSDIIMTGTEIIEIIDQMPVAERIKKKIEDIGIIPPGILFDFDSDDNEVATELVSWLATLKSEVGLRKEHTGQLKTIITKFKQEISNHLDPEISRKKQLIKDNNLDEQIQDLANQIDEKTKEIKQLEEDYDQYVGKAFIGLLGGPIGLAITGGIFGSEAEKARIRKNQLIGEKKVLTEELSVKNKLKRAVEKVGDNFLNMSITVLDAESAAANLEVVWDNIFYQINTSESSLAEIKEGTKLLTFKTQFQKVIEPWRKVEDLTTELAGLFDKALKAYIELETSISKPLI